jgi:hypothetical protein
MRHLFLQEPALAAARRVTGGLDAELRAWRGRPPTAKAHYYPYLFVDDRDSTRRAR